LGRAAAAAAATILNKFVFLLFKILLNNAELLCTISV
jgi:hypothetical protein